MSDSDSDDDNDSDHSWVENESWLEESQERFQE